MVVKGCLLEVTFMPIPFPSSHPSSAFLTASRKVPVLSRAEVVALDKREGYPRAPTAFLLSSAVRWGAQGSSSSIHHSKGEGMGGRGSTLLLLQLVGECGGSSEVVVMTVTCTPLSPLPPFFHDTSASWEGESQAEERTWA